MKTKLLFVIGLAASLTPASAQTKIAGSGKWCPFGKLA
jgi:hypothetical protein